MVKKICMAGLLRFREAVPGAFLDPSLDKFEQLVNRVGGELEKLAQAVESVCSHQFRIKLVAIWNWSSEG